MLSIGSNLGNRLSHLQSAVDRFRPWLRAVSGVYETAPWGPVPQAEYLNATVVVDDPAADADEWLRRAHAAEAAAGRRRDVRFGPRTLDVDLVDVDGRSCTGPELTLPHPRAAERAFVLVPWLEVDPAAILVGHGPVPAVVAALPPAELDGVRLRADLCLRTGGPPASVSAATPVSTPGTDG